jgi:hypothetical protein
MMPEQYERERQFHLRQRRREIARLIAFWIAGPVLGYAALRILLLIDKLTGQ